MAVTTMQSITSLASRLQTDFTVFRFVASDEFRWSYSEKTIFYDITSDDIASLLHELSHAILDHQAYRRDIELIEMERDAWRHAVILGQKYNVVVTTDDIEDSLDTYRDWLHSRSACPSCKATGIELKKRQYSCLACNIKWNVNDARICALRRYIIQA